MLVASSNEEGFTLTPTNIILQKLTLSFENKFKQNNIGLISSNVGQTIFSYNKCATNKL